jgi:hypothetical protein
MAEPKSVGKFALGIFKGLGIAFVTDINVFLLGISALLLSFSASRAVGVILVIYVLIRKADEYMGMLSWKLDMFFRVMSDDRSKFNSRTEEGPL